MEKEKITKTDQNKEDQMIFVTKLITEKSSTINSHKHACKLAQHKISIQNYRNELCNFYKSIINSSFLFCNLLHLFKTSNGLNRCSTTCVSIIKSYTLDVLE